MDQQKEMTIEDARNLLDQLAADILAGKADGNMRQYCAKRTIELGWMLDRGGIEIVVFMLGLKYDIVQG